MKAWQVSFRLVSYTPIGITGPSDISLIYIPNLQLRQLLFSI